MSTANVQERQARTKTLAVLQRRLEVRVGEGSLLVPPGLHAAIVQHGLLCDEGAARRLHLDQVLLHQEHHFEREICTHLAANGWLYAEGDAARFDRTSGLFLPDLLAWVETAQPVGEVLVGVLVSLAGSGHEIKQVQQADDGCLIEATIRYALDHESLSDAARGMMQNALSELGVVDLD